ncbi:MAG: glycoside hydrolase family 95 protein [Clostridiales bacterium]|jgi:alpha-L-fucosidase 2|nr:glycoside hydrolase family 95 protein [Clostridiales bacterium]
MKLLYKTAAETWIDCLPLGNGTLGIMADGGVFREKLYLNNDTLWSGCPKIRDRENDGGKSLEKIRSLIFKGHKLAAENLLRLTSPGDPGEAYMPLGTIFIDYKTDGQVSEYSRELDLSRALYLSKFNVGGNLVEKRAFCSFPDKAGVMSVRSVRKISFGVSFNTPLEYDTSAEGDTLFFTGRAPDTAVTGLASALPVQLNNPEYKGKAMAFAGGIKIVTDGKIVDDGGALSVEDATDTLFIIYTETGFKSYDAMPETRPETVKARVKSFLNRRFHFDYMLERHINDYAALYNRVRLKLSETGNGGDGGNTPTDELLTPVRRGIEPPVSLVELYYNYGRYLLVSSSRGSEPANLQGIWNKEIKPPWSSNYTLNINLQMNYWAAGACNLKECLEPFKRFVSEIAESGKRTAETALNAPGFAAFHNSDLWRKTTPVKGDPVYAYFPTAGVWLANEIYSAYSYTAEFLNPSVDSAETKNVLSVLEDCCRFIGGFLVAYKGNYVTCPSTSPELRYKRLLFKQSIDYASAIDVALVWQVIENYKELCGKLGLTSNLLNDVSEKQRLLYPLVPGKRGIPEWHEEYGETETGHRHFSPLYCLYPGNRISVRNLTDKALIRAASDSLERRMANGSGSTGWSAAWAAALYARLKNGEKAYACIKKMLEQFTFPNLFDKHPPNIFQIDGNLGAVAAINEMLVQTETTDENSASEKQTNTAENDGKNFAPKKRKTVTAELLPALPDAFSDGYISGITVKGGYIIDMRWQNKKVVSLAVREPFKNAPPLNILNSNLAGDIDIDGAVKIV